MLSRPISRLRQWRLPGGHRARIATGLLCLALAGGSAADEIRILVQSSPLAGSQYYAVDELQAAMRIGDRLTLVREADNAHDANAIRVEWQGHKLGYVPRAENAALAWAMDRGESVRARISRLQQHRNGRRRLEFEVTIE